MLIFRRWAVQQSRLLACQFGCESKQFSRWADIDFIVVLEWFAELVPGRSEEWVQERVQVQAQELAQVQAQEQVLESSDRDLVEGGQGQE